MTREEAVQEATTLREQGLGYDKIAPVLFEKGWASPKGGPLSSGGVWHLLYGQGNRKPRTKRNFTYQEACTRAAELYDQKYKQKRIAKALFNEGYNRVKPVTIASMIAFGVKQGWYSCKRYNPRNTPKVTRIKYPQPVAYGSPSHVPEKTPTIQDAIKFVKNLSGSAEDKFAIIELLVGMMS